MKFPRQIPLLATISNPDGQPLPHVGDEHGTSQRMLRLPDPEGPTEEHYDRAMRLLDDPATRATYEKLAERCGRPLFPFVLDDVAREPDFDSITLNSAGDRVSVSVSKPFLAEVEVRLWAPDGQVLEVGPATRRRPCLWEYTVRRPVARHELDAIEVGIRDHAGHAYLESAYVYSAPGPETPEPPEEGKTS